MLWFEITVVVVLIAINGYLAASELAIVSARKTRLQAQAEEGSTRAAAALALAENPGRFLSTVQVGLTLISVSVGAFASDTISEVFAEFLEFIGLPHSYSSPVALTLVIAVVTYLTLIFGELVPKQIALKSAERIAAAVAWPMTLLSRVASPAVSLLDASTRLGLRAFGSRPDTEPTVTEEEIKTLVAEAETAGVVEPAEKEMIAGVMRLGDRSVKTIMTPRRDVEWIDLAEEDAEVKSRIRDATHARLPVGEGGLDAISGIVETRDLLGAYLEGRPLVIRDYIKQPPVVADTSNILDVLENLQQATVHIALVVDEFGTFEGVVTQSDILAAITGDFMQAAEEDEPHSAVQREDGSWLLDGALPVDQMADVLDLNLPEEREYHTVAGYVLHEFARVPVIGETITVDGWKFEVVDMDSRRIDKVLASRAKAEEPSPERTG